MINSVSTAVLDSGIYPHIDLKSSIIAFKDFVNNQTYPYDDCGHGTHVSGIIAGTGKASNGKFKGINPGAKLVCIKVLEKNGNGKIENVLSGIDWIISHREEYNIKLVNISFGAPFFDSEKETRILINAIEKMWDNNITVVVAAGNNGPSSHSISIPGISKKVITVGSLDSRDFYSSRGPTSDCIIKPEVIVDGSRIVSCSNLSNSYTIKSGTSMATPMVTGAISYILDYKNLTPKEIKIRLRQSCKKISIPPNQQGWGMLDFTKFLSI